MSSSKCLCASVLVVLVAVLSMPTLDCAVINARNDETDHVDETVHVETDTSTEPPTEERNTTCKIQRRNFVFKTPGCHSEVIKQIRVCVGMDPTFDVYTSNGSESLSNNCIPVHERRAKPKKLKFINCEGSDGGEKIIRVYLDVVTGCVPDPKVTKIIHKRNKN